MKKDLDILSKISNIIKLIRSSLERNIHVLKEKRQEKLKEKQQLINEKNRIKREKADKLRAEKENRTKEKERIAREKAEAQELKKQQAIEKKKKEEQEKQNALNEKRRAKEAEIARKNEERLEAEKEKEAKKIKAAKLKESEKQAKKDKKLRDIELKKEKEEKRAQERREKKLAKERNKLGAKKNLKRGKIDRKQAKKIKELEIAMMDKSNELSTEQEIENIKKSIKNAKSDSVNISNILNKSLSSKKILVIEIGYNTTNITDIAINGSKDIETKRVTILDNFEIATPDGVFVDDTLTNIQPIALEIMKTIATNNIKTKDVLWSVSENSVLLRDIQDFPLQREEKANIEIVKSKASEILPINIEDYIIKYKILSVFDNEEANDDEPKSILSTELNFKDISSWIKKEKNEKANIQVIAFPKQLENKYIQLAKLCGLSTKYIDYYNNGMINILKREYRDRTSIHVKINSSSTVLYSISNGKVISQSKLNTGYYNTAKKILKYNELGSSIQEVWKNIQERNIFEVVERDEFANNYSEDTLDAIKDIRSDLETIIDKVRSEANSIIRKLDIKNIDTIELMCEEENFPDLSEDITNITGIKSLQIKSFEWINSIDDNINIINIISGLGAALDPINFTVTKSKDLNKTYNIMSLTVLTVGTVVIIGSIIYTNTVLTNLRNTKSQLETELESAHEAETIAKRTRLSDVALDVITEFTDSNTNTDQLYDIINSIEKITPTSAVYTTISSTEDSLSLSLYTETRSDAIKLLDELEKLDYFESIETSGIQSVSSADGQSNILGNFTLNIVCNYVKPEEPEDEVIEETESSDNTDNNTEATDE